MARSLFILGLGFYNINCQNRIAVQLVSSLTRLDLTKEENMCFFVCSEATDSWRTLVAGDDGLAQW